MRRMNSILRALLPAAAVLALAACSSSPTEPVETFVFEGELMFQEEKSIAFDSRKTTSADAIVDSLELVSSQREENPAQPPYVGLGIGDTEDANTQNAGQCIARPQMAFEVGQNQLFKIAVGENCLGIKDIGYLREGEMLLYRVIVHIRG